MVVVVTIDIHLEVVWHCETSSFRKPTKSSWRKISFNACVV